MMNTCPPLSLSLVSSARACCHLQQKGEEEEEEEDLYYHVKHYSLLPTYLLLLLPQLTIVIYSSDSVRFGWLTQRILFTVTTR
jgi:hypothetical protein